MMLAGMLCFSLGMIFWRDSQGDLSRAVCMFVALQGIVMIARAA